MKCSTFAFVLTLPVWIGQAPAQAAPAPADNPPRLVVLISVDQLADWVYQQGRPFFAADGGFRRLERQGVRFTGCAYQHACTETGPGHATIGTGAPACVHGISKNSWWVSERDGTVYCVGDQAEAMPDYPEGGGRGPGRLRVPTFGDSMKAHVFGSKVVTVAWKDRSAILMGGASADVCAWFEKARGMLVTNTLWCDEAPGWLRAFNDGRAIDQWFGKPWERFGPEAAYAGLVDERRYEVAHGNGSGGHSLPQPLTGGAEQPTSAYYSQIYASPFGNTIVRLAAEAALRGMDLGKDDVPDMLGVSFSSTDVVGHNFGPDSVEARDTLLRLDHELGELFRSLDQEVGEGRWTAFVTADHGVAPTPEQAMSNGVSAGRGPIDTWVRASVEKALRDAFGAPPEGGKYVAHVGDNAVYLNPDAIENPGIEVARIVAAGAERVRGVQCAYASADIEGRFDHPDPLLRALAYGMVPGRAGIAQFVLAPYWLNGGTPASHGSPHAYDREVIGFAIGAGVVEGRQFSRPVSPGFGVVLFAHLLGLPNPDGAHEHVFDEMLSGR